MKKILFLILLILAVATLCCACNKSQSVNTQREIPEVEPFVFELINEDKEYKLISVSQTDGFVTVPDSYKSKPVTVIDAEAFANCTRVTKIIIPKSVNFIEAGVFENCNWLNILITPFIGQSRDAKYLDAYFFYFFSEYDFNKINAKVQHVTVTDAFYIWNSAFRNCKSLLDISFSDTLTEIQDSAFENCENLTNIHFSKNIVSIGDSAFAQCKINTLVLPENLESIGEKSFFYCTDFMDLIIPPKVIEIQSLAFWGCFNLNRVYISDGVKKIGNGAFNTCINLTHCFIPASVTEISEDVFAECVKLVQITNLSQVSLGPLNSNQEIITSTEAAFTGSLSIDENGIETYTIEDKVYIINYLGNDITLDLSNTACNAIFNYALASSTIETLTFSENIEYLEANSLSSTNLKTIYINLPQESANNWDKDWNTDCYAEIIWDS